MTCLLFPGRHHLLTNFQLEYLTLVTAGEPGRLVDVEGQRLELTSRIDTILWVITSANHAFTRRNPLPAHRREVAIEEFADQLDARSLVFHVDDIGTSPEFAEYVLKKIAVDSQGRFRPTPADTVIGCSTPEVIDQYQRLGFRVLPVELADRASGRFSATTPWELVGGLVAAGREGRPWQTDEAFLTQVHRSTRRLYLKYGYGELIQELFGQQLLTDDGDITATRNYNTYVRAFDEGAARKYELVRDYVLPGRIVDIGCCTGAILREMTCDDRLRESDFYGVEVARPLYVECLHRKEQGGFANDHVFFYHRDFAAGPIFPPNSLHTATTFSLTHEIESYLGRQALLDFVRLVHEQLTLHGRWLNLDVVGPDEPDRIVLMELDATDGRNDDWEREFAPVEREDCQAYLAGLSTSARFRRFARDFRREEGGQLPHSHVTFGSQKLVELRLADASEFLTKKDYLDNWQSEMHETFCFWTFADWCQALKTAGFRVHSASRAFLNTWLAENRFEGRANLFVASPGGLVRHPFPPTHVLLVAEKV